MRINPHRRTSRLCGTARLICVLMLVVGPALAVHAGTRLTISIVTSWNAGTEGAGNIASPGLDFNPAAITRAANYTATYSAGNVSARTYYFWITRDADEATTWNPDFQVEISPVSGAGAGSSNWTWQVPPGVDSWGTVPSTDILQICSFRLTRNSTATITLRIRVSNITTRAGPRSPFSTLLHYYVGDTLPPP